MNNPFRPTGRDINQIEALVNLGANQSDIAAVLGITTYQIDKWKVKNTKVTELLKPKARPEYTM